MPAAPRAHRSCRRWRRRRRSPRRPRRCGRVARQAWSAQPAERAPDQRRREPSRIGLRFLERQVRDDRPGGAGGESAASELHRSSMGQHHVGVDHQHDRDAIGDRLADLQRRLQRRPGPERRGGGSVNRRPIGERIGERHAKLDQIGTRIGIGLSDRKRGLPIREAGHHVRHQGSPALTADPLEGGGDTRGAGNRRLSHLFSPAPQQDPCRPARRDRARRSPRRRRSPSSQAIACEDSSAGMIPSRRVSAWKAASACVSVTAK